MEWLTDPLITIMYIGPCVIRIGFIWNPAQFKQSSKTVLFYAKKPVQLSRTAIGHNNLDKKQIRI